MRLVLFFIVITGFVTNLFSGEQTSDISKAKQFSIERNKPILIDFMTDW